MRTMTQVAQPTKPAAPAAAILAGDSLAERRDIPGMTREAQLVPSTWNEADRTVEVVWTTGSRRRAYDYWAGESYDEELDVSAKAVDMTRFESGVVQVLDGHNTWGGVRAILGVATRGWIKSGEGRATIRLSGRAELAGVVQDIKDGIIRAISFGYSVQKYERTEAKARTDGGTVPLYRATLWSPHEISFVTVPADANASTRSAHTTDSAGEPVLLPCEFVRALPTTHEDPSMSKEDKGGAPQTGARSDDQAAQQAALDAAKKAGPDAEAVRQAAVAEQTRSASITDLCTRHGLPQLASEMIRSGATVEAARASILDELAARSAQSGGQINAFTQTVSDEYENKLRGMEEALLSRFERGAKVTDLGREFRFLKPLDMAREILESKGIKTRGMAPSTVIDRVLQVRSVGMHTTGDFTSLLANVVNKILRNAYDENPGTYRQWAREAAPLSDFKARSVVQLGAAPDLLQVNEHGEIKYGTMGDAAEGYKLLSYGRIVGITRQAMLADDLGGFDRLVRMYGGAAARLENRTVYAQLTANAALADGTALFHASRGNLGTGGGSALSFTSLKAMRTAMRSQKGMQSEELNLVPAYLLLPAALEQDGYQLTSSNYTPATKAEVNEFRQGGRTAIEPIVEPILDANSLTRWYGVASNSQVDTVEFAFLEGSDGPMTDSREGFEVDGVQIRCRHDFAAKAIDGRGMYRADGA
jgi:hypothetical protein